MATTTGGPKGIGASAINNRANRTRESTLTVHPAIDTPKAAPETPVTQPATAKAPSSTGIMTRAKAITHSVDRRSSALFTSRTQRSPTLSRHPYTGFVRPFHEGETGRKEKTESESD